MDVPKKLAKFYTKWRLGINIEKWVGVAIMMNKGRVCSIDDATKIKRAKLTIKKLRERERGINNIHV